MSKHRTKRPRRPWADPTAPLRLLHGGRPFDEDEQTKLSLPVHLAQDALLTLKARALRTGRLVPTGPELQEIATVVDIHDQLLALSTPRQMQQAMREVLARVRRQQVYRLGDAA